MVHRRLLALACCATLLSLAIPPVASADSKIHAVMAGQPISLAQAGTLSCHDFDYPVLTCFATSAEMLDDADARVHAASGLGTLALTTGYIVVFEHQTYAGAARAISRNYSYLGDIGWNDEISSLKSYGATGHFWEHSPSGGLIYYFYSTSQIPYVGDLYNDIFSSVYLT